MLEERLNGIPRQRVVWRDQGGASVTFGHLNNYLASRSGLRRRLQGQNVAVVLHRDIALGSALALLDGVASAVLIVDSNISDELLEDFLQRIDARFVLVDDHRRPASLPGRFEPVLLGDVASEVAHLRANELETPDVAARRPWLSPTRWIIPTSGTTGRPKLVAHTLRSLTRSCKVGIDEGCQFTWGSLYSITRFAGLQVLLQAFWSGSTLIFTDATAPVEQRVQTLAHLGCNCLSATPSLWRRLLMTDASARLQLRQATLGGEIVDAAVLSALRRRFPQARITHIYASTEAGVGFAVKDGRPGFPRSYLEHPPNGVELRVSQDGRLMIRPPDRSQRYVQSSDALFDREGFLDTGDRVRLEGDRVLFLGRENGALNIGGYKVQPEEVASVLLEHESIAFARVRARRSSIVGSMVEADIVLRPGTEPSRQLVGRIRSHCKDRLEAFKCPAFINFVDEIAVSASGKQTL